MDYEGFLELVRQRRSMRSFKADPILDEQVDKVIEAARFAASGFNLQPWEFVIVKDGDLRNRIVQCIRDAGTVIGAWRQPGNLGREHNRRPTTRPWDLPLPRYSSFPLVT